MSVKEALELRGKRGKLIEDAQKILSDNPKGLTAEQRKAVDDGFAAADDLLTDIKRHERAAELSAEISTAKTEVQEGAKTDARREEQIKGAQDSDEKRTAVATLEYRRAVTRAKVGVDPLELMRPESRAVVEDLQEQFWAAQRQYLAEGSPGRGRQLSAEARAILDGSKKEFRDMGISTSSLGGYLVPQGYVYQLEEAMKWVGDMVNESVVTMLNTSTGNDMPFPTDNDTTNTGERVGEGQQVSEQDAAIGSVTFKAWKYSTKMIKLSIELVQDSAFDLPTYIRKKFGIRLGRILNSDFTNGLGSGSSQPNGVLTGATVGPTAVGSTTNTGGAETGANSIGTKDLIELEHSVDKAYRQGARYMFHDSTLKSIKELLDKQGRPLWQAGIAFKAPDTVNGYPYSINNDMPVIATGAKTVLFGDLSKYNVRRVRELSIVQLNERFADYGQVALLGFARYDGQLMDAGTHPVKYLVQA